MRFHIDAKPISFGNVIFEYREFTLSIQNDHAPNNLIVLNTETRDILGTEFSATAEGIRDAMTMIDHYYVDQALKGFV
jgi:hypothetical protein